MAQASWPFDGTDTTETQYSELFRRMSQTGVWGSPQDSTLKAYGDSSGLVVKLPAGASQYAFVRGHFYQGDSAIVSVAVTSAAGGARTDMLVLELDPTANTILAKVLAGTAGSPATLPVPTQSDAGVYDLPIALIDVASGASTITAANVHDIRKFAQHVWGVWTSADRPTSPRHGQPGFNLDLNAPEWYDLTAAVWKPFSPAAITAAMISGPEQLLLSVGNSAEVGGHEVHVTQTDPSIAAPPTAGDIWISW